jgi:A/G-specific adenine glycosylase
VVDGNVERVVCRLLAVADDPGAARDRIVREAARRLVSGAVPGDLPHEPVPPESLRPGDWNQAMMELGAVVCAPLSPRCPVCPVARSCIANRAGLVTEIPKRREKKAAVDVELHAALVRRGDHFLLVRRPEGSLLSGLWELPTAADDETLAALSRRVSDVVGRRVHLPRTPSRAFRHTITNRRITVHVHEARVDVGDDGAPDAVAESPAAPDGAVWVTRQDLRDFGVSSMTKKAVGG